MTNRSRWVFILDCLFLAALFWVVRYWHSAHFGLYEDDITIIPQAVAMPFSRLIHSAYAYLIQFQGQGRPLHHILIDVFAWLGWRIAGSWGPYAIGYLITIANIVLFYWLLTRAFSRSSAFLGGLGYLLYAADTTQTYLTHSLGLQPAITFILLGCHCYLSNKRAVAYILAFISLFIYETPFLLFAAVPLLKQTWNKPLLKETLRHMGILFLMLAAVFAIRASIGEGRVSDLGLGTMLTTPVLHMLEGPAVSLGTFAYRPFQAIQGIDLEVGLAIALAFAAFMALLLRLRLPASATVKDLWRAARDPVARRALPEEIKQLGRMFAVGALLLVLAYPLTFTVRAYALSGRDTRVHFAGVAGAAILVAAVALLLIHLANAHRFWRTLALGLVALELALMAGYGFVIQRDYVNAWQYQRQFWTELLPLIQDAGPGTVVLIDPQALHDTRQIGANYWNLPRVLSQLYDFPGNAATFPVVNRLEIGWQDALIGSDGLVQVNAVTVYSVPDYYGEYDPSNTILIRAEDGHLVRLESLVIAGQEYALKPVSAPVLPGLPHGFLYDLMIVRP